jgi:hypothetical protein
MLARDERWRATDSEADRAWPVIGGKLHAIWSPAHDDRLALVQSMQPKIGDLALDDTQQYHLPGGFTAADQRPPSARSTRLALSSATPPFIRRGSVSSPIDHQAANVKSRRDLY